MLPLLRKTAISLFVLFHFGALMFWVFPPYADMVLRNSNPAGVVGNYERILFSWFEQSEGHLFRRILNGYIDYLGAHQYWDFFAPEAPVVHRYLRVCEKIIEQPDDSRVDCVNPLYKSFDGTLVQAIQSYNGRRSRSFRLTENLIGLQRQDFFESFTRYWWNQNAQAKDNRSSQAYLILTEYPLHPRSRTLNVQYGRQDTVVWITSQ